MKKYVEFLLVGRKPKTNVYNVVSKSDQALLGTIYWEAGWRQYVFDPWRKTIWSRGCLKQVIEFIQELMDERARGIKHGKEAEL